MATTREQLHAMIDALPAEHFDAVAHAIWAATVPEDDEPMTEEELASVAATRAAHARGELVPHDAALREMGL